MEAIGPGPAATRVSSGGRRRSATPQRRGPKRHAWSDTSSDSDPGLDGRSRSSHMECPPTFVMYCFATPPPEVGPLQAAEILADTEIPHVEPKSQRRAPDGALLNLTCKDIETI